MSEPQRTCFVIGPIGEPGSKERNHADMLLDFVIKEVLRERYKVIRSDERLSPDMISDQMIVDIYEADLAIADMTFHNPNAFYELGLRHASRRPVIHFVRPDYAIPFDNADYRAIRADVLTRDGILSARAQLAEYVNHIESAEYVVVNPVTRALGSRKLRLSEDPKDVLIADLQQRLAKNENMITALAQRIDFKAGYFQGGLLDNPQFAPATGSWASLALGRNLYGSPSEQAKLELAAKHRLDEIILQAIRDMSADAVAPKHGDGTKSD